MMRKIKRKLLLSLPESSTSFLSDISINFPDPSPVSRLVDRKWTNYFSTFVPANAAANADTSVATGATEREVSRETTFSLRPRPATYSREIQIEKSGRAAVPALVNERVKYTSDLARLSTSNPVLAFTLTVVMFSIAGIPPLAGFYSKAFLMFAAIGSANYVLAIIGVAMSVVSAFYYLRIVKIMYFESLISPSQRKRISSAGSMLSFMQINKEISLVCAITLSFLLFFSLHPKPVFLIAQKAALLVS